MFGYVSLGLMLIAFIILAINVVRGLLRGLQKSVGSLVAVILSAIAAFLTTGMLCKPYSVITIKVSDALHSMLSETPMAELFAISEVDGAVSAYAAMLIAPVFFAVAFIVFSIIFGIICGIIFKNLPLWLDRKSAASRLGGLGVSVVCGILVVVIVLTPVVGTINVISASGIDEALPEETAEVFAEVKEDKTLNILVSMGCGALYNQIASTKINGEKAHLSDELQAVAFIVNQASSLKGNMAEYNEEQISILRGIVDTLDKSPVLKNALAGILSEAATKWATGEEFMGISKPDAGVVFAPLMNKMVGVLRTTDATNIIADMTTMVDVFAIICESGILAEDADFIKVLANMGEKDLIAKLVKAISSNERMAVLADEITAFSLRAVALVFDIPENAEENYNELMSEIAQAVIESSSLTNKEKKDFLSRKMVDVMDEYGVDVDQKAAKNIAEGIVADLGRVENITSGDIEEFFIIYAIATESKAGNNATSKVYGNVKLMSAHGGAEAILLAGEGEKETEKAYDLVVDGEGNLIVNGRTFKNYKAADYKNSAAYKSGLEGKDFGDGTTLASAKTMKSNRVTVESIISSMGSYADCKDIDAEAHAIQALVVHAVERFSDLVVNKNTVSKLVADAGILLDDVSNTISIGQKAAAKLLTGILQSNSVSGTIGVSISNATKVADTINVKASGDSFEYSDATNAISGTLDAITSASDSNKTREEKMEATKGMIENMTPNSAEVIGVLVTPQMIQGYGVPEKNAVEVAKAVSTMFDHMGDYNVSDENDAAQFEKEAEAIDKMFQLVLNSYDAGTTNLFTSDGEKGKIDTSADELVSLSMESEVISETVDEIVYGDGTYNDNPLNIPELSESDTQQVKDAIDSYYSANGSTEELAHKLKGIAGFLNVEVKF